MNLQIRGAIDVFFTGDEECLPGGPHFDRAFYLAWTAIIGSIFGVLGVSLFQMVLSKTWYRFAFWSTTVLQVAAAIIDITIVMRWNLRIGISDKLFYILGDSMLQEVVRLGQGREGQRDGERLALGDCLERVAGARIGLRAVAPFRSRKTAHCLTCGPRNTETCASIRQRQWCSHAPRPSLSRLRWLFSLPDDGVVVSVLVMTAGGHARLYAGRYVARQMGRGVAR